MKKTGMILLIAMACAIIRANTLPEVSNVNFAQRTDGSMLIDVYYDVFDADGDTLTVNMETSDDGGETWSVSCDSISGDFGENILSGTEKHIIWDFGAEHPNIFSEEYRVRILVDDNYNEVPEGMVFVEGGSFEMGDHFNEGWLGELPVHTVTLNSFYIGQHEITHTEYIEFLNSYGVSPDGSYNGTELIDMNDSDCAVAHNGSFYFSGSDYATIPECPIIEVTWYGGLVYCNWLSEQEGLTPCYDTSDWSCDFSADGYRLPTEAEWEYASRGGINWEDDYRYSGCHEESDLSDYAWYYSNSGYQTHEVGTKLPNQLDIYDMSGNVWEWCNDWYSSSYYGSSPEDNPTGPDSGAGRVRRGGSWYNSASPCRVANRGSYYPYHSNYGLGFRLCRVSP